MKPDGCNISFTGIEKDDFVEYEWECYTHKCSVKVKIIDEISNSNEEFSLIYMFDESLTINMNLYRMDLNFIMNTFNRALKIAHDKYNEYKEYDSKN